MSLRDIVKDKDPILRTKCRRVEVFDARLHKIIDDMKETLFHACAGQDFAAPQIGIARRIALIHADGVYLEFVNPVIVSSSGSQIGQEACLSVDNRSCIVERPNKVMSIITTGMAMLVLTMLWGFVARACLP